MDIYIYIYYIYIYIYIGGYNPQYPYNLSIATPNPPPPPPHPLGPAMLLTNRRKLCHIIEPWLMQINCHKIKLKSNKYPNVDHSTELERK